MLIDDEPGVLLALKLMLGAMGGDVETFNNGTDAISKLKSGTHYDYILCDLRMPEMDGFGVLTEVRKLSPTIPFILISGHANDADVTHAKKLGMTAFLAKPFNPDEVKKIVRLGGIILTK